MRAIVKANSTPGLWLKQVNVPEVLNDSVLIKIHRTGICGTDLHIWNWDDWAQKNIPIPLVVSHEFSGEVIETGKMSVD